MCWGSFWISHFCRSTVNCAALLGSAIPRICAAPRIRSWERSIWCSRCALLCPGTARGARWERNHPGKHKPRWAEQSYLAALGQGKATSQQEHDVPRHLVLNTFPVQQGWGCPEPCPALWNPKEILWSHVTLSRERRIWWELSLVWISESLLSANSGIISWSKRWEHHQQRF